MSRRIITYGLFLILFFITGCEKSALRNFPFEKGRVELTHTPIDLNGIEYFFPMGELNVQPKDHGGFTLKGAYQFPANTAVYAPADGVVIQVSHGQREVLAIPDAPQNVWHQTYDDHLLILKVSETMMINFAHITDWSSEFEAKLPNKKFGEEGTDVAIEVNAGDILGYVGPHGAMDFSITDTELDLDFLNPGRYPGHHIYSGNIFEYFEAGLRQNLESFAFRSQPPLGGKIDYDIKGKIIGNWFLENTSNYTQWSRQLSIAYHHLYPDRITISDGSPMRDVPGIEGPGAPDVWWVKGNAPAPETIGVEEGLVKYELIYGKDHRDTYPFIDADRPVQAIMLVQALNDDKIQVEIFKGSTSSNAFTSAAKVYER